MVRKKVEGDEDQQRAAAHQAEHAGETPSERGATTGASKQRTHLPHRDSLTHEERTAAVHRGKQRTRSAQTGPPGRGGQEPEQTFRGRGRQPYGDAHERVFQAVAEAERKHGGEGPRLDEVARAAAVPREGARALLHDLMTVHGLVTELRGSDDPDLGPRYETRPGG